MTLVMDDGQVALHHGHVMDVLRELPAESVACCVTSPPYWSLRAYGTEAQVWGGDAECVHEWREATSRIATGGTGSASKKQVTNRGSQSGNQAKARALSSEMRNATITVDKLSKPPTGRDVEHDAIRAPLGVETGVQAEAIKESIESIREGFATSREGSPAGFINRSIPVEQATNEIPHDSIGNTSPRDGEALARHDAESREGTYERPTVDAPAVGASSELRSFNVNGSLGSDEVTDEYGAALVQAHKADRAFSDDITVRDHQSDEVGQIGSPLSEAIEKDRVGVLPCADAPVVAAPHGAEGAFGHLTMPGGALQGNATTDAGNGDPSVFTGDGASASESDPGRPDVEGLAAGIASDVGHGSMICDNCGAIKCELGHEPTPQMFVAHLVEVFREVKRVLKTDGVCFVNLGDSYAGSGKGPSNSLQRPASSMNNKQLDAGAVPTTWLPLTEGLRAKSLVLIPERFALAMADDGWIVRSRIAWCKRAPMPESVTDRPTSAWEHVWLFSKSPAYYWDQEAVREQHSREWWTEAAPDLHGGKIVSERGDGGNCHGLGTPSGRNMWNYWLLSPDPEPAAHFATFPRELVRRCITAGTSEKGECPQCGKSWVRVVERSTRFEGGSGRAGNTPNGKYAGTEQAESGTYDIRKGPVVDTQTTGWRPQCHHDLPPVPSTVLDPFVGSGTTTLVARSMLRRSIGIDLSESYLRDIALKKNAQMALMVPAEASA